VSVTGACSKSLEGVWIGTDFRDELKEEFNEDSPWTLHVKWEEDSFIIDSTLRKSKFPCTEFFEKLEADVKVETDKASNDSIMEEGVQYPVQYQVQYPLDPVVSDLDEDLDEDDDDKSCASEAHIELICKLCETEKSIQMPAPKFTTPKNEISEFVNNWAKENKWPENFEIDFEGRNVQQNARVVVKFKVPELSSDEFYCLIPLNAEDELKYKNFKESNVYSYSTTHFDLKQLGDPRLLVDCNAKIEEDDRETSHLLVNVYPTYDGNIPRDVRYFEGVRHTWCGTKN